MTIPLDDLSPLWRNVVRLLAVKIVALERAHEDVRQAHTTAIEELLGDFPVLQQAFEQIRQEVLENGRQAWGEMSESDIETLGQGEIEEAFSRAIRAMEKEGTRDSPPIH